MKIVLHICCGVCAAGAASVLLAEGHQVSGYYYNPNIYPEQEYQRRLQASYEIADKLGFTIVAGDYNPDIWNAAVAGLEAEPEGGSRCSVCYRLRIKQTYAFMLEQGADAFTSTLTVGPRKAASVINPIGYEIGGDRFLPRDFKKKEGFKKATEMAKRWEIYRQNYCGCVYSIRQEGHSGH